MKPSSYKVIDSDIGAWQHETCGEIERDLWELGVEEIIRIHPRKLTWNLKIIYLFEKEKSSEANLHDFGFHVNFQRCTDTTDMQVSFCDEGPFFFLGGCFKDHPQKGLFF